MIRAAMRPRIQATILNIRIGKKVSAAQSGRAMEMLHQPLIWLADNLRISYGEDALLRLCEMIVMASRKMTLRVRGQVVNLSDAPLSLRWPAWFSPTGSDNLTDAQALSSLRQNGFLSRETGVGSIAAAYDIEDVPAELARIASDEANADARATAQVAAQTKITETAPG